MKALQAPVNTSRSNRARVISAVAGCSIAVVAAAALRADCTNPECAEVAKWGTYADLNGSAPTAFIQAAERPTAKMIYGTNKVGLTILGGTAVAHDTIDVNVRPVVGTFMRDCPSTDEDGVYYVGGNPMNIGPPEAIDWTFCANDAGEGVKDSGHEGKRKNET